MTDIQTPVNTVDIEVKADNGFPEYDNPSQEITAITAHDNISAAYWTGVLTSSGWGSDAKDGVAAIPDDDDTPDDIQVTLYSDERQLLHDYWNWVDSTSPVCLSGHNSDGFDYPYLINRSLRLNVDAVHNVPVTGSASWIYDAPRSTEWAMEGIVFFDGMTALKSLEIGQRKSYSLKAVAQDVLDWDAYGLDDIDESYEDDPVGFVHYNILDVMATVGIRQEKDVMSDYDALQQLSGCLYSDAFHNKNLIDSSLIRRQSEPQ